MWKLFVFFFVLFWRVLFAGMSVEKWTLNEVKTSFSAFALFHLKIENKKMKKQMKE